MARCSVCGKDERFHKAACWALKKKGQPATLTLHGRSRCNAVVIFQDRMIMGLGELHKITNCKTCNPPSDPPCLCGAYGPHAGCVVQG